jgi:hypothetical protein
MAGSLPTTQLRCRELAYRESNGVSVRLDWDSHADEVFVRVRDHRNGDDFVLNPRKDQALTAFHHPYALRSVDGAASATEAVGAHVGGAR